MTSLGEYLFSFDEKYIKLVFPQHACTKQPQFYLVRVAVCNIVV